MMAISLSIFSLLLFTFDHAESEYGLVVQPVFTREFVWPQATLVGAPSYDTRALWIFEYDVTNCIAMAHIILVCLLVGVLSSIFVFSSLSDRCDTSRVDREPVSGTFSLSANHQ